MRYVTVPLPTGCGIVAVDEEPGATEGRLLAVLAAAEEATAAAFQLEHLTYSARIRAYGGMAYRDQPHPDAPEGMGVQLDADLRESLARFEGGEALVAEYDRELAELTAQAADPFTPLALARQLVGRTPALDTVDDDVPWVATCDNCGCLHRPGHTAVEGTDGYLPALVVHEPVGGCAPRFPAQRPETAAGECDCHVPRELAAAVRAPTFVEPAPCSRTPRRT